MAKSGHQPPRALIVLRGTSFASHGRRQDDFIWSHQYKAHIWKGRELSLEEFDKEWEHCWEFYRNYADGIKPVILKCGWVNVEKAREAMREKEAKERYAGFNAGLQAGAQA